MLSRGGRCGAILWRFHGEPGGEARQVGAPAQVEPGEVETAAKPGQAPSSTSSRTPARSAARAVPGASAQSSMARCGTPGCAAAAAATRPRNQAAPPWPPAPGAESSSTPRGPAAASAARASASPCTVTARVKLTRAVTVDPEAPLCQGFCLPREMSRGKGCVASRGMMNDAEGDPVADATARLEAAVERLSRALASRPAPAPATEGEGTGADREAVAALAARLDDTIARLRGVLGEEA
jgi:hypothetical protein